MNHRIRSYNELDQRRYLDRQKRYASAFGGGGGDAAPSLKDVLLGVHGLVPGQFGFWTPSHSTSALEAGGVDANPTEVDAGAGIGNNADGVYFLQTATNGTGIEVRSHSNRQQVTPSQSPAFLWKFALTTLTTVRFFVGISGSTTLGGTDTPSNFTGIRFSTEASDTKWQLYQSGPSSETVTPTVKTPVSNEALYALIQLGPSSTIVELLDSTFTTILSNAETSNIPADTTTHVNLIVAENRAAIQAQIRTYFMHMLLKPDSGLS